MNYPRSSASSKDESKMLRKKIRAQEVPAADDAEEVAEDALR